MGLLEIGLRGLTAYQTAMNVTAQNLTNVSTPFYSRKQAIFSETPFFNGVEIRDVRRVYDEVANQNFLNTEFSASRLDTFYSQLADFEKSLDTDETSVNKYINDSLAALQQLSNNVSSTGTRASYLDRLQSIANRLHALGSEISKRKMILRDDVGQTVSQANALITQIASLNNQISQTPAGSRASLLDQRNSLVHELAQYIDFNTLDDGQDRVSISLSNGINLVSGTNTNLLSVAASDFDSSNLRILIGSDSSLSEITPFISDGRLKALGDLRTVLDTADSGLGRLALAMTAKFNEQNHLGVDVRGALGGNIFTDMNTTTISLNRVFARLGNAGTGIAMSASIDDVNALTTSDYRLIMTSATNYTLTRMSDNSVVSSGALGSYPATISADGFTTTVTAGTFVAGDMFTIRPTMNAAQNMNVSIVDPQKLALAFAVTAAKNQSNTGSGSIEIESVLDTTTAAFANASSKVLTPPLRVHFISDTSYEILDMTNPGSPTVLEGPLVYDPTSGKALFPTAASYDPGFRVNLKGTINAGDTFDISYNSDGTGNGNALAMTKLYSAATMANSGLTFTQAYQGVSGDISVRTNTAGQQLKAAKTLFDLAEDRFYQVSGASEQEEVENLMYYQQAYMASSQVIQAARGIFDTIISLMR